MVDVLKTVLRLVRSLWRVVTRRGGVVRGKGPVPAMPHGWGYRVPPMPRMPDELQFVIEYDPNVKINRSGDKVPPAKGAE